MTEPPPGIAPPRADLVWVGGAFGVAGCAVGLLLFLAGCLGYGAAFELAAVPVGLGTVGMTLALIGGLRRNTAGPSDSHVVAAAFVAILSLLGGLLELGVWLHWPILIGAR